MRVAAPKLKMVTEDDGKEGLGVTLGGCPLCKLGGVTLLLWRISAAHIVTHESSSASHMSSGPARVMPCLPLQDLFWCASGGCAPCTVTCIYQPLSSSPGVGAGSVKCSGSPKCKLYLSQSCPLSPSLSLQIALPLLLALQT